MFVTPTTLENVKRLSTAGDVQLVTGGSNVLDAGLDIYANSMHVGTANVFMTVFFCALILLAISLGSFMLGYAILRACSHRKNSPRAQQLLVDYPFFIRAWSLRLVSFIHLQQYPELIDMSSA
jgi:hypothetical protein